MSRGREVEEMRIRLEMDRQRRDADLRAKADSLALALSDLLSVIDRLGTVRTPAAEAAREALKAWTERKA